MFYDSCGGGAAVGSLLREECLSGEACLIPPAAARLPFARFSLRFYVNVAARNSSSFLALIGYARSTSVCVMAQPASFPAEAPR